MTTQILTHSSQSKHYTIKGFQLLADDKRLVVFAAAQAQKAADFILDRKGGNDETAS